MKPSSKELAEPRGRILATSPKVGQPFRDAGAYALPAAAALVVGSAPVQVASAVGP
jgi:hypothetical protein